MNRPLSRREREAATSDRIKQFPTRPDQGEICVSLPEKRESWRTIIIIYGKSRSIVLRLRNGLGLVLSEIARYRIDMILILVYVPFTHTYRHINTHAHTTKAN